MTRPMELRSPAIIEIQSGQPVEVGELNASGYEFRHPPLNVLLVCDDGYPASVVKDHIQALKQYSRHRYFSVNPLRTNGRLPLLSSFDAIVIHYSIAIIYDSYLPLPYREVIAAFPGLKIQFIQDEYRSINRVVSQMRALGVHVLFSALRAHTARAVYCNHTGLNDRYIFSTLPGYVPDYLLSVESPPIRERPLHVTYRAREVPYWLGRHSRQKQEIADGFRSIADKYGLQVDISAREGERLYGQHWIDLILSGKAILGTEGGASIFDFDSEAERETQEYLKMHPGASFEEVHKNVLARYEGNIVHRAFTPRLLEAIALRTALVLFPGEYAGILQPWRHYIPLERDFSNVAEVVAALKDAALLQELVDRTYKEIACSGEFSYRTFASRFDVAVDLALQHLSEAQSATGPIASALPLRKNNAIGIPLRLQQEKASLVAGLARMRRLLGRFI